ncbi:4-aminobutyrate aminotransferase-like enzyme [Arthrobacter sp. CAN_A214]|uniref:hypothetical protein n=1 Tax=Arthrobacter sp. CAN_A214 TaxID=2787720 RepID=UPI0018C952E1
MATINAMRGEKMVEHAARLGREVFGPGLVELAAKHPSVGEVRCGDSTASTLHRR